MWLIWSASRLRLNLRGSTLRHFCSVALQFGNGTAIAFLMFRLCSQWSCSVYHLQYVEWCALWDRIPVVESGFIMKYLWLFIHLWVGGFWRVREYMYVCMGGGVMCYLESICRVLPRAFLWWVCFGGIKSHIKAFKLHLLQDQRN